MYMMVIDVWTYNFSVKNKKQIINILYSFFHFISMATTAVSKHTKNDRHGMYCHHSTIVTQNVQSKRFYNILSNNI